jgi:hypothetical protein
MDKAAFLDFTTEIIKRSDTAQGFEVLPLRWVVERTFGWMTRWRRLVRDYEERIGSAPPVGKLLLDDVPDVLDSSCLARNLFGELLAQTLKVDVGEVECQTFGLILTDIRRPNSRIDDPMQFLTQQSVI